MTTYIESDDSCGYDEREAAAVRAEEQALNGGPWHNSDYDRDSDDVSFDD